MQLTPDLEPLVSERPPYGPLSEAGRALVLAPAACATEPGRSLREVEVTDA